MTKTAATQVVAIALAALMAFSMLAGTNALAGHQYRVAAAAQTQSQARVVASNAHVVLVGQRVAQL
jgi:hypothetical protein